MGLQTDHILQKFLRGALAGTTLANSNGLRELNTALSQRQFQVVLDNLADKVRPLPNTRYMPIGHANHPANYSDHFKFQDFTKVMDHLLQTRLLSLSKASYTFVSSLIMNERVTLQLEHKHQNISLTAITKMLEKVQTILQNQIHQPELTMLYILNCVLIIIGGLIFGAMVILRNSVTNWIVRNQWKNANMGRKSDLTTLINGTEPIDLEESQ